jgi:hypothetical protein
MTAIRPTASATGAPATEIEAAEAVEAADAAAASRDAHHRGELERTAERSRGRGRGRSRPADAVLPYVNRELSWLEFNARVLHEAADTRNPLLERVRFLAIFASNLDEFFQVRISGVREQRRAGATAKTPTTRTATP